MATTDFDIYVNKYKDLINKSSRIVGEQYEYFIELRINLMKAKIQKKSFSKESLRILDFGCGIGTTEVYMNNHFPNSKIYGVDTSSESIKATERIGLNNVTFLKIESPILPFEDNYFDFIYSNGTFHHIERNIHITVIQQLFRVLKYGGDIFIFENNPYNPLMIKAMKNSPIDKYAKVIYPKYLKNIIKKAGFKFNTINYYVFYPKCLKFLRFTEQYLRWIPIGAQYFIWATKNYN